MRRFIASLLLPLGIAVATASATDAHAQSAAPPVATAPENEHVETEWYGWQTILVDIAAFGTMLIGASSGSSALGYTGLGLYAFGPPAVHAAHGQGGAAAGDFFIRLGAPVLLGVVGYAIDASANPCKPGADWCFTGLGGAAIGVLLGYVTAVVLDAAVLAREPITKKHAPDVGAYKLRWTPMVGATPNRGWNAGIGAVF